MHFVHSAEVQSGLAETSLAVHTAAAVAGRAVPGDLGMLAQAGKAYHPYSGADCTCSAAY